MTNDESELESRCHEILGQMLSDIVQARKNKCPRFHGVDQLRDILQPQDCAEEEMRAVQAKIDESNDEDQSRA